MMTRRENEVLVVGAGPCGLAAACMLLRQGVAVRVLDAAAEPRSGSRAILLWPPVLEVLRTAGALADAERAGVRARAMNYRLPGGHVVRVGLEPLNQPLMLPQAQTEAVLNSALEALGGKVERSMRVTDVQADGDVVRVEVLGPSGTDVVEAGWLIGADGVRSTVRDRLGIEFVGEQLPDTILVAEGRLDGDLDLSELHYYLGQPAGMLLAPLPDGRFRLGTPVPAGTTVTPELVGQLLDERGPGNLRMDDLSVQSTFTSQERVAARLRQGRCFLVGDAAHTHSAFGGQGLNLGLQDVANLTWKLGGVIAGRLHPAVLDTYEVERRHAAAETMRATHRMGRVLLAPPAAARVRNGVLRLLDATGVLQRALPPMLAGWKLRYPLDAGALVAGGRGRRGGRGPAGPGTRAPQQFLDLLDATEPVLRLVTIGSAAGELARWGTAAAGHFPGLVSHEHRTDGAPGFVLLRPDGYVAASGLVPADLDIAEPLLAGLRHTAQAPHTPGSSHPGTSNPQEKA
jgi:2-polyprenyl-6-methoxyphenol hydroxylase-like FAD-dependent oxidoreductase